MVTVTPHDAVPRKIELSVLVRSVLVISAREVYDHATKSIVWTLLGFATIASVLATQVGVQLLQERQSAYAALVSDRQEHLRRAGNVAVGWQLETSLRVIRQPEPLSSILVGSEASTPQFWDFGPSGPRTGPPYIGDTIETTLDLEFITRVLLGLLAVFIATESVGGERANGSLLALFGQPVRPAAVLSGKLMGGALVLATSVIIVTSAAVIVAAANHRAVVTSVFVLSVWAVAAAAWLYLFTVFILGVLVSTIARSYRAAVVITVTLWAICGVAGVALPLAVARTWAPTRTVWSLENERERIQQDRSHRAQLDMGERYLTGIAAGVDWTRIDQDLQVRVTASARLQPVWDAYVKTLHADLDALTDTRIAALRRQRDIARWISVVSPGAQFAAAVTNLAATGEANAIRWEAAITQHQRKLNYSLFDDPARLSLLVPAPPQRGPGPDGRWIVALTRRPRVDVADLPAFTLEPRSFAGRLSDAAPNLILMCLGVLMLGMPTFVRFRRMNV